MRKIKSTNGTGCIKDTGTVYRAMRIIRTSPSFFEDMNEKILRIDCRLFISGVRLTNIPKSFGHTDSVVPVSVPGKGEMITSKADVAQEVSW